MKGLIIGVITVFTLSLNAQSGLNTGVHLGFLGPSYFDGPFDEVDNWDYYGRHLGGIKFGLNLRYQFNKTWELETGVSQGYRLTELSDTSTVSRVGLNGGSFTQPYEFFEIPLKIHYKYQLNKHPKIKLVSGLGTSMAFMGDFTSDWSMSINGISSPDKEYYKTKYVGTIVLSFGFERKYNNNHGSSYFGLTGSYNFNNSMTMAALNTGQGDYFKSSSLSYFCFDYKYYLPWVNKINGFSRKKKEVTE